MRQQISLGIDPEDLVDAVGQAGYGRGARYARNGAVRQVLWNRSESALVGTVSGSGGQQYTATAFFSLERGARVFDYGDCSCPVGADCKHVAAMVLYVTDMAEQNGSGCHALTGRAGSRRSDRCWGHRSSGRKSGHRSRSN